MKDSVLNYKIGRKLEYIIPIRECLGNVVESTKMYETTKIQDGKIVLDNGVIGFKTGLEIVILGINDEGKIVSTEKRFIKNNKFATWIGRVVQIDGIKYVINETNNTKIRLCESENVMPETAVSYKKPQEQTK